MYHLKTNRILVFCFVLGLLECRCSLLRAQSSFPVNIRFASYTINDGLSESVVMAIAEDKYGEICIGTESRLDIFNGYNFTHLGYTNENQKGVKSANDLALVSQITPLPNGSVFILAHDDFSFLFNPADRSFISLDEVLNNASDSMDPRKLLCVLPTEKGAVWLGTNDGILIADQEEKTFPGFPHVTPLFTGDSVKIISMKEDSQGRIWALTMQDDILIFDASTHQLLYRILPSKLGMKKGNTHVVLYADKSKGVWIGTSHGIYHFEGVKSGKPFLKKIVLKGRKKNYPNVRVSSLLMDDEGLLWIGTLSTGILLYDAEEGKIVDHLVQTPFYPQTLNSNTIHCLMEDSRHRIWVGTDNGLNKYDRSTQKFVTYSQDKTDPRKKLSIVFSIIGVDSQHIMAISKGEGEGDAMLVNTVTGEMEEVRPVAGYEEWVYCLARDPEGTIFAGGYHGLNIIRKKGIHYFIKRLQPPELKVLDHEEISHLFSEGDSLLFIGTKRNGLYLWHRNKHLLTHFAHKADDPYSICNNNIETIAQDRKGNIWVGTFNGISRFDQANRQFHNFLNFQEDEKNPPTLATSIYDNGSYLWIATFNYGLIRFDPYTHTFKRYTTADGLPDNTLNACVADNSGHLWISSNRGVSQFFIEGNKFRNFTKKDGLQSNEFDVMSVYKNEKGEIFFGGIYGINKINPARLMMDTLPVPLMVSNIEVHSSEQLKNIFPGDEHTLNLSYRQNTLIFQFAALNFIEPKYNHYRYKLEKTDKNKVADNDNTALWNFLTLETFIDKTWIDGGSRNTVVYSHLPPGEYTFKVNAMNVDGIWNKDPLTYAIIIYPPFWGTTWFKALMLLLILLLFYGIYRLRMRAVKKAHKQKMERAELDQKIKQLERMALQAQMNPHFIFNSLNSIKAYMLSNETDEAVDYLNDFAALIRKVLQHSKKDTISLSEELEAIESYVRLEERRLKKKVYLSVEAEEEMSLTNVFIPPLIIQPFIENAIWHGFRFKPGDGTIDIAVREESELLKVSITDNGVGREKARVYRVGRFKMQSMGVSITQERLMHFNGRKIENIVYEDLPAHRGTKVTLWIPLDGTRC